MPANPGLTSGPPRVMAGQLSGAQLTVVLRANLLAEMLPISQTRAQMLGLIFAFHHLRAIMMTFAQCEAYAAEYKSLAQQSGVTEGRAAMLKNVARTFTGLASQLDRLAAHTRDKAR